MVIIEQLIDIYQNHENWHRKKLSYDDSKEYFIRLLSSGNIIIFMYGDKLCGYVEFWRITPEQFRKILDRDFYVFEENITDGSICYISALFVHDKHRNRSARPAVDVPTSAPSRSLSQRGRCLSSSSSSILRSLSVRGLLPVPPLPTQNLNWKWKRAWAVRRRLLGSTHGRHHLPRVTHPYVRYCIVVLTTRSETQKKIFNLQI